jgi:putative nucleotidyltransferase with HDIG domain
MSQVAIKERREKPSRRRGGAAQPRKRATKAPGRSPRSNGAPPKAASAAEGHAGRGGRRLASAFEVVSELPALAEARRRFMLACEREGSSPAELAEAIESDVALMIAVMSAANNAGGPRGRTGGVREAIERLGLRGVREAVVEVDTYDPFETPTVIAERHERFRRHAVATRHAADRIAEAARLGDRDELAVAALLHDVGHLVLTELYGDFEGIDHQYASPDDRVRRERRELGIDHALVGAVLVRRWALPVNIAEAIERHHSPDAQGPAAAIRLADLMVHYAGGDAAPAETMIEAGSALGLDCERLAPLLYEFPHSGEARRRATDPCPLSRREIDALRGLAEGKVYKQIAQELSLSVSTIRTHLHNVYRKIGAVDRAQAVLIARDRGWI